VNSSALIATAWEHELPLTYHDREFIVTGVREGFHILNVDDVHECVEVDNYESATNLANRAKVDAQVITEIINGRYRKVDEKPDIVSALGDIPKKGSEKIRLIHDCSRPKGKALNDFASPSPFKYQSIQDAVDMIKPGYFMGKLDIQSAYRAVKSHLSNWRATGLKWRFAGDNFDTYMVDERLMFGGSKCPEVFNRITQGVKAIMAANGYKNIVIYLDDMLVIGATYEQCLRTMNALLRLLHRLGFHINYSKMEGPVQRLTFLGIVLDTLSMTLCIPHDKMQDVRNSLLRVNGARKITKRQLQSLAGKLSWLTQCIHGGRFHVQCLFDRISELGCPWHRTRVTVDMRKDIKWWLDFMHLFNGLTPMVDNRPASPVCIDACNIADGAYYDGEVIHTPWVSPPASVSAHKS
jgi:hypothetical protein